MKRKSQPQTKDYALEQYEAFKKGEEMPFYAQPYLHLVKTKGQEEADRILSDYQRIHHSTPCVRDGLLLRSYTKWKKENEDKQI